MPFILLSAKEADEYLYTYTRPLSSQIWTFPWSFIYSNPSVNFYAIWMIKRIDRPVALRLSGMWIFFLLGKNKTFANRQTGTWAKKMDKGERVEELTSWTGRVCYALFYVCIALKNIWFPSKVKYMELWTTREEVLSRPRHFFCTNGSFYFMFFVLSMVLRLDAEHIENKPNVGRRRVY